MSATKKMKGRIFMEKTGFHAEKCLKVISEPFPSQNKLPNGRTCSFVKVKWFNTKKESILSLHHLIASSSLQELVPVEDSHPFDEYISASPLQKQDLKLVTLLDKESGFNVSWHVEDLDDDVSNDYSWGLYLDGFLIGYCTIGYADDVPGAIENHPAYVDDCYLLSDVYVCPEYRNRGYGLRMITEVIKGRWEMEEKAPVFLVCFDDKVQSFYQKAGFSRIEDPEDISCMVLEP